jgi:Tripartite tricarboxylate transporter TctB family
MNESGNTARTDLLGGAGWVAFGLWILIEALRMDRFKSMGASVYTMPGFVPGMIGGVIIALGLMLALRGWRKRINIQSTDPKEPVEPLINQRIALMLPLTLVYAIALLGRLPFWLATALFVTGFTWAFTPPEQPKLRRIITSLLSGVITTAVVILVFQEIFLVRLP